MSSRSQAIDMQDRALGQCSEEMRYRLLCSVVRVDPDWAQGWVTLGHHLGEIGLLEASVGAYECARRCMDPDDVGMRARVACNMAMRLHHLGRTDEALKEADLCTSLDPRMTFGWINKAMIYSRIGRHDKAVDAGDLAVECAGPNEPEAELSLAFAHMFAGDFVNGLRHFESRFRYKAALRQYAEWPIPKWDGGQVGRLLVVSEQGLGDALSMARFIPAAKVLASEVLFAVQPELVRLLTPSLPRAKVIPFPKTYPEVDAWISVGSLPIALGLSQDDIVNCPGLDVPRFHVPPGWEASKDRKKIGICWGGSKANDIDKWRSLAGPEPFLRLLEVPGVDLYSFQIGDRAPELHTCGAVGLIQDLTPWIRDCADAAAILSKMDLVITVETFLGHLAGFMDVPCWVLDSYNGGDWRIGRGDRPPLWYGEHRIFRQGPDAQWGPVWDRVVEALGEWNE